MTQHNLVKKSKKYLTENCSSFKQSQNSFALLWFTFEIFFIKYFTNRSRWKYIQFQNLNGWVSTFQLNKALVMFPTFFLWTLFTFVAYSNLDSGLKWNSKLKTFLILILFTFYFLSSLQEQRLLRALDAESSMSQMFWFYSGTKSAE